MLKQLTQEDLAEISEFFSSTINNYLMSKISAKEISDLDIKINVIYNDKKLDVDIDVDMFLDKLSKVTDDDLNSAISKAYLELNDFIDNNYRE